MTTAAREADAPAAAKPTGAKPSAVRSQLNAICDLIERTHGPDAVLEYFHGKLAGVDEPIKLPFGGRPPAERQYTETAAVIVSHFRKYDADERVKGTSVARALGMAAGTFYRECRPLIEAGILVNDNDREGYGQGPNFPPAVGEEHSS